MTEPATEGGERPRAYLTVGGRTIAQHQLDIALALGCRRVICVSRRPSPELAALQHEARDAGAQLQVVAGGRGLADLVNADDVLVVLSEGLLAEPRAALEMLAVDDGDAVLVQPIEAGLAAGFERIDLHRAGGGAMRIPGRLVERLSELPSDCDVPSALTRIALQHRVATRDIPEALRAGSRWRLVRSETEAQDVEAGWIALHLGENRTASPSEQIARIAVETFGPTLLHAGSNSTVLSAAVALSLVLALGAGWLGAIATGLVFVAIAWLLREAALLLQRVERGTLEQRAAGPPLLAALGGAVDAAIVVLIVWKAPLPETLTLAQRAFAPLMLVGLLRLVGRLFDPRWGRWIADRAVIALILALGAGLGLLAGTTELIALAIAAAAIVHSGGAARR